MKHVPIPSAILITALLVAQTAYAQQPPDVVQSDFGTNTMNEVQKQQRVNAAQAERIASLERQLIDIQAALVELQPKHQLVAQR